MQPSRRAGHPRGQMTLPIASQPASSKGPAPQGDALLRGIERLRRDLDAVILAHYYQDAEIQEIADLVGDSLQLSQQAAATKAKVIVFCGVHFMAETAKILNPDKQVLLPDLDAGCSLSDRHLGAWVSKKTGRDLVLWPGFCIVHEQFTERQLTKLKVRHPQAKLIAHPECEESVLAIADYVGSTRGLLEYVKGSPAKSFIVATEVGILHLMQKARPDAELIPAPPSSGCNCAICPYMRLNSLEKVYLCMRDRTPEITLPEDVRLRALEPVRRMLELSASGSP